MMVLGASARAIKFRSKYRGNIGGSFLLHTKDIAEKDGITYLPIYMASIL